MIPFLFKDFMPPFIRCRDICLMPFFLHHFFKPFWSSQKWPRKLAWGFSMRACSVASVISDSLWPHGLWSTRLLCPLDSLGKNTGVGCHFLQQEIFPTQDRTQVSCLAGWFFTTWATGEEEKPNRDHWMLAGWSGRPYLGMTPSEIRAHQQPRWVCSWGQELDWYKMVCPLERASEWQRYREARYVSRAAAGVRNTHVWTSRRDG